MTPDTSNLDTPPPRRRLGVVALCVGAVIAASGLIHVIVQKALYEPPGSTVYVFASPSPIPPLPRPSLEKVTPAPVSGTRKLVALPKFADEVQVATVTEAPHVHVTGNMLAHGVTAPDNAARRRIALLLAARDHLLVAEPRSFTVAGAPAIEVASANRFNWNELEIFIFKPAADGVVIIRIDCHFYFSLEPDEIRREYQETLARCAGVVASLEWIS